MTQGEHDVASPVARADWRQQLLLAATLAAVAGCVDAVSFGRVFEVFPANQSGNAVLLGIAVGDASAAAAWRPAVAILGFGVGVAIAVLMGSRVARGHRTELLVAVETLLLVPLAVMLVTVSQPATELAGTASGLLLTSASMAMGIQTEIIGRVAGVTIATTYQSGAIVHIAEAAVRRDGPRDRAATLESDRVVVIGSVLAAYVAGAALGAALRSWGGVLLVPLAFLVVLAGVGSFVERGGRVRRPARDG